MLTRDKSLDLGREYGMDNEAIATVETPHSHTHQPLTKRLRSIRARACSPCLQTWR